MEASLFANDVITRGEKVKIANKVGSKKMEYLIMEIIIPSLNKKFSKKYKSFLETMKTNEDVDLQTMAENLGKFTCAFKSSNYLLFVWLINSLT